MLRRVIACAALLSIIALSATYLAWNFLAPTAKLPDRSTGVTAAGVSINDPRAFKGYTLIAPMLSHHTYLVDMEGRIVHAWKSDFLPAFGACLLDNGHLLRTGKLKFGHPEGGGRVQEFDWNGELVWDYVFERKNQQCHHDCKRLPNGNVLLIVADRKSAKEVSDSLARSEKEGDLPVDALVEVKPTGKKSGEIVWEWHAWDHLVQESDRALNNFGKVAEHPERIDLHFGRSSVEKTVTKPEDLDKLQKLGYVGGTAKDRARLPAEWTHFNSVDYNAELDQIMVSVRAFSEIWIIDHSTTTQEAAGTTGGKYGKGGDLLYRWGNPQAYRAGQAADQQLFRQHDAHWIPGGLPGAGHALVFNNGSGRPDGSYSSVDEIVLPLSKDGTYERGAGQAFGPGQTAWTYTAPVKTEFFSDFISGAQRLPGGNTLICSGNNQVVFEVTPRQDVVWKFTLSSERELPMPPPPGGKLKTAAGTMGGLFRAYRYGVDHPALRGRELTPGKMIGER